MTLADNRPLNDKEFNRAVAAARDMVKIDIEAEARSVGGSFSTNIGRPSHVWANETSAGKEIIEFSDMLASGNRCAIDRLRFLCKPFRHINLLTSYNELDPRDAIQISVNAHRSWLEEAIAHPCWEGALARTHQFADLIPEELIVNWPVVMGETGILCYGAVVNPETCAFQEHMAVLWLFGILDRLWSIENPIVVEIGAGHGALAYAIKRFVPNARYLLFDIPRSLAFSAAYLTVVSPSLWENLLIYPNHLFAEITSKLKADLVISVGGCLSECGPVQAAYYVAGAARMLASNGVLLEETDDGSVRCGHDPRPLLESEFKYYESARIEGPYAPHEGCIIRANVPIDSILTKKGWVNG